MRNVKENVVLPPGGQPGTGARVFTCGDTFTFTFTFSHLADAFIQSDLQLGST